MGWNISASNRPKERERGRARVRDGARSRRVRGQCRHLRERESCTQITVNEISIRDNE